MQGKPMTPLSASMYGVATSEQQASMAADVVWLTAENGRLRARLATYESALRDLVAVMAIHDKTPEEYNALARARKALEAK